MTFKITPVETYDAAYPRRRANTAATSRRPPFLRWLLTVILGLFLALFSSACGDDGDDDNTDGDTTEEYESTLGFVSPDFSDGDLDMDEEPDLPDWVVSDGVAPPYDPDPPMEDEIDDDPDIDDWDVLEGDNHPMDPDPPMETEDDTDDTVDQWDDAWEQPDKPRPDGDDDMEPELEEEEYVLDGDMAAYRCTK